MRTDGAREEKCGRCRAQKVHRFLGVWVRRVLVASRLLSHSACECRTPWRGRSPRRKPRRRNTRVYYALGTPSVTCGAVHSKAMPRRAHFISSMHNEAAGTAVHTENSVTLVEVEAGAPLSACKSTAGGWAEGTLCISARALVNLQASSKSRALATYSQFPHLSVSRLANVA